MKKSVSVLLSIFMILGSIFSISLTAFAADTDDSMTVLEYEVMEDDTVKITRYDSLSTTYDIPSEIDSKKVTVIGTKAFSGCHVLKKVTVPDTVVTIESSAFSSCEKLNTVVLGNSVESIGNRAFADCGVLTNINFPGSLKTIGNNAFIRCACLITAVIPDSVTSIGNYAFSDCTDLESVDFGNGELTIGEFAFGWCLKLKEINLGYNVKEIKSNAFCACIKVTDFTIESEDCVIFDNANTLPDNAVVHAYEGSTAYSYATRYGKEFVALQKPFEKLLGDTDLDGEITILDATAIQCYLAYKMELCENSLINADVDEDSKVNIIDATLIQLKVAGLL